MNHTHIVQKFPLQYSIAQFLCCNGNVGKCVFISLSRILHDSFDMGSQEIDMLAPSVSLCKFVMLGKSYKYLQALVFPL